MVNMSSLSSVPKTTIWLWPTGLFPRRILYYFRAKGITTSTLQQHNIELIPVTLEPLNGLVAMSGYETRPVDCSLPVVRIQHVDGSEFWVKESMAILDYFEEVFSTNEGYPNLLGSNIEQRARTRDIISLLSETSHWSLVFLIHSNSSTLSWSGLTAEQMSPSTAAHAQKKFHVLLSKLETWVDLDVRRNQMKSLSGEGGDMTLADIVLMAQIEYAEMMFGIDFVEEHGVLRLWCERMKTECWYVSNEELKNVESGRNWEIVLEK